MSVTPKYAVALVTGVLLCSLAAPAWADTKPADSSMPFVLTNAVETDGAVLAQEEATMTERKEVEATTTESDKLPLSLAVSYYLYSDYIFRFVNYSEYASEGREKPNHQVTTDFGWDFGDFGAVHFATFWEWYAAQKQLDPEKGGQNLQETDYVVYWTLPIKQIATDFTLGWASYTYPNAKTVNTNEWYFRLDHNDAWMWKWLLPDNEDGVLNPSFYFVHDFDQLGGVWMEFKFYHDFAIPGIDNLTITPSWMVAVDGCYYEDNTFRFAGDQWGLVTAYDLTPVLHLPDWAGSVVVKGELYYNNPWGTFERGGFARDVLWGGMSVNWSWGG